MGVVTKRWSESLLRLVVMVHFSSIPAMDKCHVTRDAKGRRDLLGSDAPVVPAQGCTSTVVGRQYTYSLDRTAGATVWRVKVTADD